MPDEASTGKGRRFASDLQRIRQKKGVSIEKLQEETKIPSGLIEAFEETGLFDHPIFNRVYLRSFVRNYARVINISPAFTLKALEEALAGNYEGRLATEYLGISEEEAEKTTEETEARASAPAADPTPQAPKDSTEAEPEPPSADEPAFEKEPVSTPPAEKETTPAEEESAAEAKSAEPSKEELTAAGASASGAGASPSSASKKASRQSRRRSRRSTSRSSSRQQLLYLGAALVVIALGGWLLFSFMNGENAGQAEEANASAPVATDTAGAAQQGQLPAEEVATQSVDIGPTMDFNVVAAQGPVRELRVKVDEEVRRPYWIEEGNEMTFEAQNRISFEPPTEATSERPLDMIALQLEGVQYPTDQRDAQGRIVITRETAQAFLDSAAAQRPTP